MKRESVQRANAKLRQAIARVHGQLDAHHAQPHASGPISCKRGCSACCRQIVVCELIEAEYIVARNPDAVARALPKLVEHARLANAIPDNLDTEESTARAARAYWKLNIPCAFLDERGECSIYADRPVPCRTHFVLSDPALCGTEDPSPVLVADFGSRDSAAEHMIRLAGASRTPGGVGRGWDSPVLIGTLPQLVVHAVFGGEPLPPPTRTTVPAGRRIADDRRGG